MNKQFAINAADAMLAKAGLKTYTELLAELSEKKAAKEMSERWIWRSMIARCLNPTDKTYARYGGRGVKIAAEWLDFDEFFRDMGARPSRKHSLDRIDNNGDYCKSNCRWASIYEQSRNRRTNVNITWNGKTQCLKDWAKEFGMDQTTLRYRIDTWPLSKAMTTPVKPRSAAK